jgi:CheY-like chemotaxis protein
MRPNALDSGRPPAANGRMSGVPRVLVVDDDADIRDTLVMVLGSRGYTVSVAADGAEALERLRAMSPPPCLVLLDLMMPGMNGFEVWQAMESSGLTAIPVVALTGAGPAVTARAQELRLEVLHKPIGLAQLLQAVARFC